jgi:hypothetical protein
MNTDVWASRRAVPNVRIPDLSATGGALGSIGANGWNGALGGYEVFQQ